MAKIINFKTREQENSVVALFDMACNLIFRPDTTTDPSREVGRIVQTAITHTGLNPHHFSTEKLARLEMLVSG